jgi:hypothetical protein
VRVAGVNDWRVGLQRALTESRLAHAAADRAQQRLAGAAPFGTGLLADFQLHRTMLAAMASDQVSAEQGAAAGARIAEEARVRWIADRTAVRVADQLLDRRSAARAEARARREAAELDDLAATAWLRRTTEQTETAR